jgi:hypothetical protein
MVVTVYQYTEAPLILEHVYKIEEENEGDTIVFYDRVDGRTETGPDDIVKFEGPHGND